MGKQEAVPHRQCTAEFKLEAVRLTEPLGGNQAAQRSGIPDRVCGTGHDVPAVGRIASSP